MSKARIGATLTALASLAVMLAPATAVAEERVCRGTIGATTVDNLRVPQNAQCVLQGTYVKGTAKVEANAVLRAEGVRVVGNVQGENARRVAVVQDSRVGGSVQVVQGAAARVARSRINGDILYDENDDALSAVNNRIGGNLQAFQNTGGVEIRKNVIDGNLQCKANRPRPVGGGNVVHGNKEDQCARL
jgi:hypothetical protein